MTLDFTPFFKKYEAIVSMADGVFTKVKTEFAENVKCDLKCADCCHALFDLTLIEALYINDRFNAEYSGAEKADLIEKANRANRRIYKIKRDAHKEYMGGKNEIDILGRMAAERVRCPLLNDSDMCDLYDSRPITCRLYGIPTSASNMSHTCGLSGFVEGEKYPTVNMDVIYSQLYEISSALVASIKTKHVKMGDMLVPVSMAILTEFNEDYLGLTGEKEE